MVSAQALTEHQAAVLHQEHLGAAAKTPAELEIVLLRIRKSRCSAVPPLAGQAEASSRGFGLVLISARTSSVCEERTSSKGS